MAYILHIETATKVCSVALSKDGELIALKENGGEDYSHGEELTGFIQDVMSASGVSFKELNAISMSSGPGSYTGLRIGAATAKGLCFALNIPLIAIDSLVSLANLIQGKYAERNISPVIDARRMEVYNCIYAPDLNPIKPISADIIEPDTYETFEPLVVLGDGAEKLVEVWKDRDIIFDMETTVSAKGQISIAFDAYRSGEFVDVAYWEPFYLKDFVAGVKKVAKT